MGKLHRILVLGGIENRDAVITHSNDDYGMLAGSLLVR